jgi:sarcosine oxidase
MLGTADSTLVQGAARSATEHGLAHEILDAAEIRRRFPIFRPWPEEVGVFEPEAGFLDPEGSIEVSLRLAASAGATVWTDTSVLGWQRSGDGLVLETNRGAVSCGTAIVAAGAWAGALLESSGVPLTVERQVMYWFRPPAGSVRFSADHAPVFIWEWSRGRLFYGIPDHGAGFKVARHHEGEPAVADQVDRSIRPDEVAAMRAILTRTMPELKAPPVDAVTCLYTNTPDRHFVLGAHPGEPRLLIGSACSGHGFKFATVLGEVLADLATNGVSRFDLSPFRPTRFMAS